MLWTPKQERKVMNSISVKSEMQQESVWEGSLEVVVQIPSKSFIHSWIHSFILPSMAQAVCGRNSEYNSQSEKQISVLTERRVQRQTNKCAATVQCGKSWERSKRSDLRAQSVKRGVLLKAGKTGRERKQPTQEAPGPRGAAGAGPDVKTKERPESQLIPESNHPPSNRQSSF